MPIHIFFIKGKALISTYFRQIILLVTPLSCISLNACITPPANDSLSLTTTLPTRWQYAKPALAIHSTPDKPNSKIGWQPFHDKALAQRIEKALKKNDDLAAAAIRVQRAQWQLALADSRFLPNIEASIGVQTGNVLAEQSAWKPSFNAQAQLNYEIDLWGKLSSQKSAAAWLLAASEDDRDSVALILIGDVAATYWKQCFTQLRIIRQQQQIENAKKIKALVALRYETGSTSLLEKKEAQETLAQHQAMLAKLMQQAVEYSQAMSILLNNMTITSNDSDYYLSTSHQTFSSPSPSLNTSILPTLPAIPDVNAHIPAATLAQRPDVRAAERRVRTAIATQQANQLSLYPAINLTASTGTASAALVDILRNPITTLGVKLALPFLQWQERKIQWQLSKTETQERVIAFQQTLYKAFSEVEIALAAHQHFAKQQQALTVALAAAKDAERLYEIRYSTGAIALRPWLDAQNRVFQAENELNEIQLNALINYVKLYQALGGAE